MTGNERDGNSMPQGHHLHSVLTWDLYLIWIIWSTGPGMHIILILQALGSDLNIQTNSAAQAAKIHVCLRSKEGVFKYWNNWGEKKHILVLIVMWPSWMDPIYTCACHSTSRCGLTGLTALRSLCEFKPDRSSYGNHKILMPTMVMCKWGKCSQAGPKSLVRHVHPQAQRPHPKMSALSWFLLQFAT